jgi:uncharacterized MAPEG superfamily protein
MPAIVRAWNPLSRAWPDALIARAGISSKPFVFFAAMAIAVVLTQRNDAHTALGAEVYFWARLAYLPIYLIGIPYLRTAVYAVSLWGLLQLLEALLA